MKNNKIKNAFNKAAPYYDTHCFLQKKVGSDLIALIKTYHTLFTHIIDLGCGTGILTRQLAAELAYSDFHAIDIADQLLIKAKSQLATFNITIYENDFDDLNTHPDYFDLAFSNMALHWSANFSVILKKIALILNKTGILAFSIPLAGTLNELNSICKLNHFAEANLIIKQLQLNGYQVLTHQSEKIVIPFENLRAALKSIKNVGANAVDKPAAAHHLRALLQKPISLTYQMGYFIAQKNPGNYGS